MFIRRRKLKPKHVRAVNKLMISFEGDLIRDQRLLENYMKGPRPSVPKQVNQIVDAFVQVRHLKEEDDFYLAVAKAWVKDRAKIPHLVSLASYIGFLTLWLGLLLILYFAERVSGVPFFLFLFGFIFLPIIGLLSALLGRGWRKALLALLNLSNNVISGMILIQ